MRTTTPTTTTTATVRATLLLALTAAATLLAAGCSRNDERTAGQKLDAAVARTEAGTASATRSAQAKLDNAVTRVGAAVDDAKITAAINARLAEDPTLSALRINVDTSGGKVSLHGTAPDVAARDRATQLAQAVQGVLSVDNQLQVRG